jgi:hypothetical protein
MEDRHFDNWTRTLVGASPRRQMARTLAGAAAAGVLAAVGVTRVVEAKQCRDHADCPGCARCDREPGEKKGRCRDGCGRSKVCCNGICEIPGPDTCCTRREHCSDERGCLACQIETGRCKSGACAEDDPDLLCNGVCCQSADMTCVGTIFRECRPNERVTEEDGCCPSGRETCGTPSDPAFAKRECCDDDETCVREKCCSNQKKCGNACCEGDRVCNRRTGKCCVPCLDGRCCPGDQKCVDTGVLGARFCCDRPCGERSDGTFETCCDPGQRCLDGECRDDCPAGRLTAQGVCCSSPVQLCRRFVDDEFCCEAGLECCRPESGESDVCCRPDRCLAPGFCCAGGASLCGGPTMNHCRPEGNECCGDFSCPIGTNCEC